MGLLELMFEEKKNLVLEDVILCFSPRSWDGAEHGQEFLGKLISQKKSWIMSFLHEQGWIKPRGLVEAAAPSCSHSCSGAFQGFLVAIQEEAAHGRSHPQLLIRLQSGFGGKNAPSIFPSQS